MFSFLCRPKVLFIRTFVSSRCEFDPVSESSHFLRSHGQRTELDHTLLRVRKWAAFENGVINELPIYGNFTIYKREYPRKWTSYGQKENILVNLKKLGSQSAKITLCVFFLTHHQGQRSLSACSHGGYRTRGNQTLQRVRM